jgi:transcriptional regulator with XRE-family HTH domain
MSIGERLREERERLGFNQTDFAGLGEASLRSQIEWEKGKAYPNAKILAAIAAAGADVQYILTGIRAGGAIAQESASYTVLTPREAALVDNYRNIEDEGGKRFVEQSAQMAAKADKDETQSRTKKAG